MSEENQEYLVGFARYYFQKTRKVYCRKCQLDVPCLSPIDCDYNELTGICKEQLISGICSDACWDACSEDEIILYKFLYPLYLHKDCKKAKVHLT